MYLSFNNINIMPYSFFRGPTNKCMWISLKITFWIVHSVGHLFDNSTFSKLKFVCLDTAQCSRDVPNYPEKKGELANSLARWFVNSVGNSPLNSSLFASINCRVLRTLLSIIHLSVFPCSVSVWQQKDVIMSVFLLQPPGRNKRNRLTAEGLGVHS